MTKYNFQPIARNFKGGHYEGINLTKYSAYISRRLAEQIQKWTHATIEIDKQSKAIKLTKSKDTAQAFLLSRNTTHDLPQSFSPTTLIKELPPGHYLTTEVTATTVILEKE